LPIFQAIRRLIANAWREQDKQSALKELRVLATRGRENFAIGRHVIMHKVNLLLEGEGVGKT